MSELSDQMVLDDAIQPFMGEIKQKLKKNYNVLTLQDADIIEVWASNLEEEILKISYLSEFYPIIAFDTEFPGTVKSPQKFNEDDDDFQMIKENVNALKLIQLGLCLSDDKGNIPEKGLIWQFNFKFDIKDDYFLPEAIQMLREAGINFEKLNQFGCDHMKFAELMISSGLILNDDVKWICFHGGYDFSYFLKLLINVNLSDSNQEFNYNLIQYFPVFYDIKYLINEFESIKNLGLNNLANELKLQRIGPQHQAGSDALITQRVFFKLQELYFRGNQKLDRAQNLIYGIGKGYKKKDFSKLSNNVEVDQMQNDYNQQNQLNMFGMNWQLNNYFMHNNMYMINQNDYLQQQNLMKKKKK